MHVMHAQLHNRNSTHKAKHMAVIRNIAIAAQQTSTGMPVHHSGSDRHLSLEQANPHGAGLVTCRRTVQVSWREVMEPKVPQRPQQH